MLHPSIEALRGRLVRLLRQPGAASLRPFWADLQASWRDADRRFDEGDPAAFLDKWACGSLWQRVQDLETAVPDTLRPQLVRHRLWTIDDAVFSCWADTVHRREEHGDDRYLKLALDRLVEGLPDDRLAELTRAVAPLASPGLGYVVFSLVRRFMASPLPEARGEALAAFRLPLGATYKALSLAAIAPLLDAASLEAEIEACWELTRREMSAGPDQAAYRSAEWSRLITLSAPGPRRQRTLELEALVDRLPSLLRGVCQDHPDLNGAVGVAWASLGESDRALAWARKAELREQPSTLAMVIAALPSPRREIEAHALLAGASPQDLGGVISCLQQLSPALARACLEASRRMPDEDRRWEEQALLPHLGPEEVEQVLARPLGEGASLRRLVRELAARAEHQPEAPIGPHARAWLDLAIEALTASGVEDRPALEAVLEALPPGERGAVFARVLGWIAAPGDPADEDQRGTLREDLRDAAALLSPEEQARHQTGMDTVDPPQGIDETSRLLREARLGPGRGDPIGQAILELASTPDRFPELEAALRLLVGDRRAPLLLCLFRAGPWARLALACRDDTWWPQWLRRLALVPEVAPAEEAELLAIGGILTAEGLVDWLDAHPPAVLRDLEARLDAAEVAALVAALGRRPRRPWGDSFLEWVSAAPQPAATAEELRATEARLTARDDGWSDPGWRELAWAWLPLGGEHAVATARQIHAQSEQSEALFSLGLALRQGGLVTEGLAGMIRCYDPQSSLFPAARRAVDAGFGAGVLALGRRQLDASIRIGILSECARGQSPLSPVIVGELDAEVGALLVSGERARHEAFGHAAPFLSPGVRRRLWGRCFSEPWHQSAVPFSWQSSGVLAITASIEPDRALDLLRLLVLPGEEAPGQQAAPSSAP